MNYRFVIGIGSQRAGSTLLHRLLDASSEVFMHPAKELHYFDTLYGIRSPEVLKDFSMRQLIRQTDRIVNATNTNFVAKRKYKCYLRTRRILATSAIEKVHYIDLFRPCLMNKKLLGEITPEYMLFDDAALAKMRAVIGADAAIILLCRNPVKRFISAVKLINNYNNLNFTDDTAKVWINKMFRDKTAWLQNQDQYNAYSQTIERYSKHFPHFTAISYDDLINSPEETAKHLVDTLGFKINSDIFKDKTNKTVNELTETFKISEDIIEKLTVRYQDEQIFLNNFFGKPIVK